LFLEGGFPGLGLAEEHYCGFGDKLACVCLGWSTTGLMGDAFDATA
jgi:hypothetical protein